ncbi:ATP-binding protein [Paraburkholderia bannensis]|uniref:ATP-binding protein n=1 Tax=Paraburkholderia bannensis TaxID=765414 RepID=UPI002AB7C9CB|nr:winged helix-turn-helix domain-containing protein [Paraburkholderia bannensis]
MNYATADSPSLDSRTLVIQVGHCELDLGARALRRDGAVVELGSRAFDVLATIAQAAGRIVSKGELMEAVWPDTIVEENNIHVQLSAIRKALGADRKLILTVSGRGYQLVAATPEAQSAALPPPESAAGPSALPVRDALLGREDAIAEVRAMIASARVVTLVGAGGIGKTGMAREIARQLAAEQAVDIRFVELAALAAHDTHDAHDARSAMIRAFANACGLPAAGHEADLRSVASRLAGLRGVLVIDSAEHVVEHVAELIGLIVCANPQVRILATSRLRLRVAHEVVYRVGPLELPEAGDGRDAILRSPAVGLFLRQWLSNGVHADMSDDRLRVVGEICRRLDGIPLALELAAGRASVLGLEGLCEGLDEPLLYLAGGYRTAQPRHRTLRAAFDWSFAMLDADEQRVFRRLSVFDQAFSPEAASQIARDATLSSQAVMDCVGELADKSLVEIQFEGAEVKYRLSTPARAYGREKLLAEGEICMIFERHASYVSEQLPKLAIETMTSKPLSSSWAVQAAPFMRA